MNRWTLHGGYSNQTRINSYPFRALAAGERNGLTVHLKLLPEDIDYTCNSPVPGFHVIVHTPARYPLASQGSFLVPINSLVKAEVTPTMITTSESLAKYGEETRKCYFPDEKPLAFFKSYTLNNCKLECHTNHTLKLCGCVEFFMPSMKKENLTISNLILNFSGFNSTKICNKKKLNCVLNVSNTLQKADIFFNVRSSERPKKLEKIENCNCLPMCYDLTYNVQVSTYSYSFKDHFIGNFGSSFFENMSPGLVLTLFYCKILITFFRNLSQLKIYFKSNQFVTTQRNELYGYTDFIANFGGLLGLFTGFSVLSFIELIYFLSLRLICNRRLYGHWAGHGL